jgi:hypothetical protein
MSFKMLESQSNQPKDTGTMKKKILQHVVTEAMRKHMKENKLLSGSIDYRANLPFGTAYALIYRNPVPVKVLEKLATWLHAEG